jgi:hypothetical protein
VKVDVEGSELRLFRGAKETLQKKSVLAFVVEFTEENMRKSGYSALQLAAQLIEYGYQPYKLATEAADLIPFEVKESIEYENILFTHDLAAVLYRIRQTPMENARRSNEIVDRGLAAEALVRSLWSTEKEATKRLALVNELTAECRSKDKLVNDLTAECRSKDKLVNDLTAECRSRDKLVNDLTAECRSRDKLVNDLTAECRSRDKLVNDLTAQCRSRDQTIAELRRELAATEGRR